MKQISVGAKLWSIVLGLALAMVVLVFGLQRHVQQVAQETARIVQFNEERAQLATQWKGMTDLAVDRLVNSVSSRDEELSASLQAKVKKDIEAISEVQKRLETLTVTPESKAQLEKAGAERARVLKITAQIQEQRANFNYNEAGRIMREQLVPAVAAYSAEQLNFVSLQHERRDAAKLEGEQTLRQAQWVGAGVTVFVLAAVLWLSWLLVRSITQPLARAVGLADAIAAGDLTQDVHDERGDELGRLLRSLSAMGGKLRQVVGEVRSGVESVTAAASEIATGNHDLSARTEQTAANLEETAASMEELTATVTQSADTARQANQLAANAAQAAEKGGQVVGQVVTSMQQITDSSRKISDIIGVIDGIAFQTNILALNAAVEAARAGEQGRGFAVVAGEVRSLAQRSAEAAKEIKSLITTSVDNVEAGSNQVEQAGQSMSEIVTSVRRVSDLIGEITASSTEQRDGIGQVNQAVANLDQMTQQNAALVEEASAAAASMREQAQRLAQVVSVFNVGGAASSRAVQQLPQAAQAHTAATPKAVSAPAYKPAAAKPAVKAAPAAPRIAAPKAAPATAAAAGADDDWESF
ncbi:hypothetical protein GCM10022279_31780 [Comamonas faecalis]|uniref:HAMP domain-containing protein n=2 Tax=Comamonas faecalis TaxID=1387849 RepID=A0ABP7S1G7_9BURK